MSWYRLYVVIMTKTRESQRHNILSYFIKLSRKFILQKLKKVDHIASYCPRIMRSVSLTVNQGRKQKLWISILMLSTFIALEHREVR